VAPIRTWYQPQPEPGQYTFSPPERGHLPDEVILETMGSLDAAALVEEIQPPPAWPIVPAELVSNLVLEASIEFVDVDADEEYAANEPADLDEARRRSWTSSAPRQGPGPASSPDCRRDLRPGAAAEV
jgi:hypothetical protein